jgi:hypothetical protein
MPDIAADLAGADAPIAATRIGNSVGAGASDGLRSGSFESARMTRGHRDNGVR